MRKQQTFLLEEKILNQLRQKVLDHQVKTGEKITQSELVAKALAKAGIK